MKFSDHTAPERAFARPVELNEPGGFHEILCNHGTLLLRLNQSALRDLDFLVREAFMSAAEADRAEIWGILTGTAAPDHSMVTVLDVIPIESKDRSGPDFRPSEADLGSFADAIAECSKRRRRVIGYFRSHPGDTVSLRIEDGNLLRRFFPGGCSIILVQANLAEPTTAWFCQWEDGEDVRLVDRLQLGTTPGVSHETTPEATQLKTQSVSNAPLANGDHRGIAAKGVPEHRSQPEARPEAQELERRLDAMVVPPPHERKGFQALAGLVTASSRLSLREASIAVAAAIVFFALGRISTPRRPVVDPAPLDLKVELHDSIVDVKWNPGSPAARDAERGALDIVDGADVSRVNLDRAQLRAGHYAYVPKRPDQTCLITLYRKNNPVVRATQSVHLNVSQAPTMASLAPQPNDPRLAAAEPPSRKPSPEQKAKPRANRVRPRWYDDGL